MVEHNWPLRRRLREDHQHFTKSDLLEILSEVEGDDPVWIDNYWQPLRQIAQRPIEMISHGPDGWHIG